MSEFEKPKMENQDLKAPLEGSDPPDIREQAANIFQPANEQEVYVIQQAIVSIQSEIDRIKKQELDFGESGAKDQGITAHDEAKLVNLEDELQKLKTKLEKK